MIKKKYLILCKQVLLKKLLSVALVCFLLHTNKNLIASDSTGVKKDTVKTGWNFGILPAISFDTDLGFQYGGVVNAFYYGNGSRYPKYDHSLYFEISNTTHGSGINRFFYDSEKLLKHIRFSFDLSYLNDQAMCFYGFNGIQSNYNPDYIQNDNPKYISRLFYNYKRNMTRMEPVFQGTVKDNLKWVGGIGIYNYQISGIDRDKLNKGKSDADRLPDTNVLYQKYVDWGLIDGDEKSGGWFNHIIAGLAYDSRDNEANPMHGVRDEIIMGVAPKCFSNSGNSLKITAIHRHYIAIVEDKLSFCYRLLWQTNRGNMSWYAKQLILKSFPLGAYSEGVGGGKTVRGILRYRLLGEDFAFGNFEFRYMFARTRLMSQNFQLALNAFYDAGIVTRNIPLQLESVPEEERNRYFTSSMTDDIHHSFGLGLRVIMNRNFIVAFEYGKAIRKVDGISGFYINLNYLF